MCAFTKIRGDAFYLAFLLRKDLHLYVKSGILYPNGTRWIQVPLSACIHGKPGALCAPFWNCYFLHLPSYHLPCLPARARAAAQPARAAVFFCPVLAFCTKTRFLHWQRCPLYGLRSRSNPSIIQAEQVFQSRFSCCTTRPGRAGAGPIQGRKGFLQAPCFSKDQQSKAVRVKCRINGELCCGRRRSFPAVRSLHPAAAWTWARAAVTAGARCERCRISRPSFMRFHRMGRAVFCPPRLDSEKEALP